MWIMTITPTQMRPPSRGGHIMTINTIRKLLRSKFGPRNYRITADGEIYVYGTMPNTNQDAFFLWGWVGDSYTNQLLSEIAEESANCGEIGRLSGTYRH